MSKPGGKGIELFWEGKRKRLGRLLQLPFKTLEIVGEGNGPPTHGHRCGGDWYNLLIWGDNKLAMNSLLKDFEGRINLIYIDPPFATGTDFRVPIKIGGGSSKESLEVKAYRDTWGEGLPSYLQMIYDRLVLMKRLLAEDGSIYVHLDAHVSHYVKVIMDEVFGEENFQREIIWRIGWVSGYKTATRNWVRNHDTILFYTKSPRYVFNKIYIPYTPGYRRRGGEKPKGRGIPIEDVWGLHHEEGLTSIPVSYTHLTLPTKA